jgi:hypothetical protein
MKLDRRTSTWLGGLMLVLLCVLYTWATWQFFTKRVPGGNDFMAHYSVWQAYLWYGIDPYSDEAALFTQNAIYGRPALPGEDQNRLTYPFYSIILHGPFIFIEYTLARAIYMMLLQAALIIGIGLTLSRLGWKPPVWLLVAIIIWSFLDYPQARGLILGQFAIWAFLSLAATLWFLNRGKDLAAGCVLVLSTVKPSLVYFVIPFLFIWAIWQKRWSFLAAFMGLLGVLVLGSTLVLPSWIGGMFYRITHFTDYAIGQNPVEFLTYQVLPGLGKPGAIVISLVLVLGMLAAWRPALRVQAGPAFELALGITLVVSNLVVPRTASTNYVLMLVPILWVFSILDRYGRPGRAIILASMLASFIGLWTLHYATVVVKQEQPIMFVPTPLVLGVALLLSARSVKE